MSVRAPSTATSSPRIPPLAAPLHVISPHSPGLANPTSTIAPLTRRALNEKRIRELSGEGSQSEGLDSPTYDGDIESSSTVGGTPVHPSHHQAPHHVRRPASPTPTSGLLLDTPGGSATSPLGSHRDPTPKASRANLAPVNHHTEYVTPEDVPIASSEALQLAAAKATLLQSRGSAKGPPKMYTSPKELSEDNIKSFVRRAIEGRGEEDGVKRWWKTNEPEEGKVVRVYADGVYDLFHFGHALQLRQAKLSFPRVHLMVGVCSDALCAAQKSEPAMTHAERCECVRHCRWADEVLADAPWVVDQAWLDKHQIDYIAHDEEVYPTKEMADVYAFAKKSGRFVPTRRTPSISTSDLLERIVRGYRDGFFDSKLEKNGHPELLAADVDWDSSGSIDRRERRIAAARKK